jgi:hypothetical protein
MRKKEEEKRRGAFCRARWFGMTAATIARYY